MRKHCLYTNNNHKMNVSYKILKAEKLIFQFYEGTVTLQNLFEFQAYLTLDPNYENQDALIDIRNADICILPTEVQGMIEIFNSIKGGKERKLGIVLSPVYCQLLLALLCKNKNRLNIDLEFFRNKKDALRWLGKQELRVSLKNIINEARMEHKLVCYSY